MPNITVFIERENKAKKITARSIDELLSKLGINPEEVLIARNNELTTKNAKLKNNDEIRLLSVISGG